jgi:hypothetical protein
MLIISRSNLLRFPIGESLWGGFFWRTILNPLSETQAMKTVTTNVFTFNELTDKAKEQARAWYRERIDYSDCWKTVYEDANTVGLKVDQLDRHRTCKGSFKDDALFCAHAIIDNHGADCETYQTAADFLAKRDSIVNIAEKDENGDFADEGELDDQLDECEADFLRSILEDYAIMLERDQEYLVSDEAVDEAIIANDYTFLANGEPFAA